MRRKKLVEVAVVLVDGMYVILINGEVRGSWLDGNGDTIPAERMLYAFAEFFGFWGRLRFADLTRKLRKELNQADKIDDYDEREQAMYDVVEKFVADNPDTWWTYDPYVSKMRRKQPDFDTAHRFGDWE